MRIKKLELVGFKSFKDRTVIQFDEGITGIVGPNGCGKSNIVDALVWVMGEMSAKHLRGSSMEDVIFAGAEGYAPVGMAEVSLTLENDGGPFPVKFLKHSEIMVTRRLHRSGESEYLINREPARLKDVQEIFMDTGAGSKGFSIVEQGAIGRIVTAKPEERRTLIEEAAGITKFKARKRESQRKLQATDQNLVRLQDIIAELKRQLDSLQRQAQRAERYRKLKKEIEDLELWITSLEFLKLREKTQDTQSIFDSSQAELQEAQAQVARLEAEIEQWRAELTEREFQVNSEQAEVQELQTDVQNRETEIRELRFGIEQARQRREMTGNMLKENETRASFLQKDLDLVTQRLDRVGEEAQSLQAQFLEKKQTFEESNARCQEIDEVLTQARREVLTVSQAESSADSKIQSLEETLTGIEESEAKALEVKSELDRQLSDFEKRRKRVFNELEEQRQMHLDIVRDVESLQAEKEDLGNKFEEKQGQVETYKDQLNEVTSRLYGLENLQDNLEGFQEGVKNIMFWQREKLDGVPKEEQELRAQFRPVAEVVEVPQEYELAMEAVLGPRLQMLLSETEQASLEAVEFLKTKQTGRSSFYHMDGSPADYTPAAAPVPAAQKRLTDVIRVPEKFSGSVHRLLDRVAVVESLSDAIQLQKSHSDWTFVTPDGDLVSSDGVITGGARESADSGVLKRRREIKELSERREELSGKLALAQESMARLKEDMRRLENELESAQKKGTEHEILLAGLKKDLERADTECTNARQAIERQQREVIAVQEQKLRRQDELKALRERLTELRARKQELEEQIENSQVELLQARQGLDGMQTEVTRLQVESAKKSQEYDGLQREHEMLSRSLSEVEQQMARMSSESNQSTEAISTNEVLLEERKVQLEKRIRDLEERRKGVAELRDAYEERHAQVREFEKNLNEWRQKQNQLQSRMNESQLGLEQARMKEAYLIEQMMERYTVDLNDIAEQYRNREGDAEAEGKHLKELKEKLNRIGDVNLSAIEEYDELSERYEFLKTQYDDLVEAKEQLRKVIDRINRICSRRFKETFEAVNERFIKVFPVLFGGGEARLILIEDPEKNEMGIDIIAKPPGKKSQSVTLLSGGEKALTAVSLIFSIFLVKPSPYCLLDEVDAPLDDANVMRFNDLVKEMAKRSQIIVVTHNKHTMEVAHKLYGVTMEEKGVSKMVSVNLSQAQQAVG